MSFGGIHKYITFNVSIGIRELYNLIMHSYMSPTHVLKIFMIKRHYAYKSSGEGGGEELGAIFYIIILI